MYIYTYAPSWISEFPHSIDDFRSPFAISINERDCKFFDSIFRFLISISISFWFRSPCVTNWTHISSHVAQIIWSYLQFVRHTVHIVRTRLSNVLQIRFQISIPDFDFDFILISITMRHGLSAQHCTSPKLFDDAYLTRLPYVFTLRVPYAYLTRTLRVPYTRLHYAFTLRVYLTRTLRVPYAHHIRVHYALNYWWRLPYMDAKLFNATKTSFWEHNSSDQYYMYPQSLLKEHVVGEPIAAWVWYRIAAYTYIHFYIIYKFRAYILECLLYFCIANLHTYLQMCMPHLIYDMHMPNPTLWWKYM